MNANSPYKCPPLRCDYCGQFVSYESLENGTAKREMLTPDSDYSREDWETACASCCKPVEASK